MPGVESLLTVPTCACSRCGPMVQVGSSHEGELDNFHRMNLLGFLQYESLQLASCAISSFSPFATAWGQQNASSRWKTYYSSNLEYRTLLRDPSIEARDPVVLLRTPIEVFNQLFFLGQLPSRHLTIRWMKGKPTSRGESHTTATATQIWINPTHPSHFLAPWRVLETLLHEMCHVFFQRHACVQGSGCGGDARCVQLWKINYGRTGHGRAWLGLSAAIEDAAPRLLSGFSVRLGRHRAATEELRAGGWWPGPRELRAYDKTLRDAAVVLLRSRDDDLVMGRKVTRWAASLCPESLSVGFGRNGWRRGSMV